MLYICTSLIVLFCLVVVAHNSKLRVVNVDTVFWLEDHSPLGKVSATCMTLLKHIHSHVFQVFEVFGPVAHPYYSIRIHRNDEKELSYAVGSKVFFVSNDSNLTYYVFPNHIEKYVLSVSVHHSYNM